MSSDPKCGLSLTISAPDSCLGLGEVYYYSDTVLGEWLLHLLTGLAFQLCQLISFLWQVGRNCEVMNLAILCC